MSGRAERDQGRVESAKLVEQAWRYEAVEAARLCAPAEDRDRLVEGRIGFLPQDVWDLRSCERLGEGGVEMDDGGRADRGVCFGETGHLATGLEASFRAVDTDKDAIEDRAGDCQGLCRLVGCCARGHG
jgi:hypothetical protein